MYLILLLSDAPMHENCNTPHRKLVHLLSVFRPISYVQERTERSRPNIYGPFMHYLLYEQGAV